MFVTTKVRSACVLFLMLFTLSACGGTGGSQTSASGTSAVVPSSSGSTLTDDHHRRSTAAPTPTASPIPGTAPTPAPNAGNAAYYQGCPVFTPGDYYNADISAAPVDPKSAAIIAGLGNPTFNSGTAQFYIQLNKEKVNLANNSTPLYTTVGKADAYGDNTPHNPVFWNETQQPWANGFYISPLSDAHTMTLNTQTCKLYEGYSQAWTAPQGPLYGYSGRSWDLTKPMQVGANGVNGPMASGLCLFCGLVRWDGELSVGQINHALNFYWPTGQGVSQHGYVRPADDGTVPCTSNCTTPLHYGNHIRLKASYPCPTTPQAQALCVALKKYGAYYADQGAPAFEGALGQDGVDHTNYSDIQDNFVYKIRITDFDVLQEQVTCMSGYSCT